MTDRADDDLRLNTLERFTKGEKSALVLEEHSHCEVPAGCGGVVLRWRDPAAGLQVLLSLAVPAPAEIFLDGGLCELRRLQLSLGEHLLAIHLHPVVDQTLPDVLLASAQIDQPGRDNDPFAALTSAGDGRWRVTTDAPAGDGWSCDLGFDDRAWSALVATPLPVLPEGPAWHYEHLRDQGAAALSLPGGELWLRKRFVVDASEDG